MNSAEWGLLNPAQVSQWLNFEGRNPQWQYDADDRESMAAKQTEGVAYLWNRLATEGTALLADEVGMGKTYQALGVAALLWKMKPNARVLVMAPNREICSHWKREFKMLVQNHYRERDHNVRNIVDGGPVPSVRLCYKLDALVRDVASGVGHLYLTTITTLSGLVPRSEKNEGNLNRVAANAAKGIHRQLKLALGEDGFDLIIIDEAHYLRNTGGGSQRVAAARALFGEEGDRLGRRNLLLTATPSHTRLSNVRSILSFFTDVDRFDPEGHKADGEMARILLEHYALRRLRLMEGEGGLHSKLHYRREDHCPSGFEGRPNAEMFFALYQKRLVADLKKQQENRSLMYGYLEGFESTGLRTAEEPSDSTLGADNDEPAREDFAKARDTELLRELTQSYAEVMNEFPDHPKYGAIVEQCLPESLYAPESPLTDLKHLIFVRRIPSVRELTQRMNAGYDSLLASMMVKALGMDEEDVAVQAWRQQRWSREGFDQLLQQAGKSEQQQEEELDSDYVGVDGEADDYLASRIAELFVVKKELGGQTDCANVRLRFVKPESLFSLFMEPASDYLIGRYGHYYPTEGTRKADYGNAALYERISNWHSAAALKTALGAQAAPEAAYDQPLETAWGLVMPLLPEPLRQKIEGWAKDDKSIAENFANYLKAGLLYASPVMVELYCWYATFRESHSGRDVQVSYRRFIEWVEPRLPDSLFLKYFIAALETFEALCGKIIDHGLQEWEREWKSLKRLTSPAWYASGDNSDGRQRLILGFNTPFYPNVLVSTSVLQEGVNLHLQCYQVHHYGLAGSPGDNEQRVGRLDRLFGCVNSRLNGGSNTDKDLKIFYPYLQHSVDEDQLASFIERKHRVEEQMDACLQTDFDKTVQLSVAEDWTRFLRQPLLRDEAPVEDPYPAKFTPGSAASYLPFPTHSVEEVFSWLEGLVQQVIDPQQEYFQRVDGDDVTRRTLFLVDPLVEHEGARRHQPVFVNLNFSSDLSALVPETAYLVTLESPIANRINLEQFYQQDTDALVLLEKRVKKLNRQFPLARLVINESAENSYLYLAAQVDMPLFVKQGHLEMLSLHEVQMAFTHLKEFADALERVLHDHQQDLSPEDIKSKSQSVDIPERHTAPSVDKRAARRWEYCPTECGATLALRAKIKHSPEEAVASLLPTGTDTRSPFLNLLVLNQHYPLVRFETAGQGVEIQLHYPEADMQEAERHFLESWYDYVLSAC